MTEQPKNPVEGGSFIRHPDGSLERRREDDAPAPAEKPKPAGKGSRKES